MDVKIPKTRFLIAAVIAVIADLIQWVFAPIMGEGFLSPFPVIFHKREGYFFVVWPLNWNTPSSKAVGRWLLT